ncbi:hypothetical protein CDAR_532051 [Caerostris darwini]|uniref:Uncharacterized protein n=1 Tax=Caerostris darwini TaxID=1538125 RepID=A0AAV4R5L5_9ARAC|nr:hypothetical protein CDAR_532051 [Caerostris darwini]
MLVYQATCSSNVDVVINLAGLVVTVQLHTVGCSLGCEPQMVLEVAVFFLGYAGSGMYFMGHFLYVGLLPIVAVRAPGGSNVGPNMLQMQHMLGSCSSD